MIGEGHIVGNHTVRHKSSPKLSPSELTEELKGVADYFKEITGTELHRYFRPPMGEYNETTLKTAFEAGYATIFWSFAYEDWLTNKQPGAETAHKKVVKGLHSGCILLLHAVSSSNAEALGDIIDSARNLGYEFKSLDNLKGGNELWRHLQ
jgi:peptidoglycan-N-acetylmuramic acid deacetylase